MPEENVLIAGVFERIGIDGSFYTIKFNGEKTKKEANVPDHKEAVKILTQELLDHGVVSDLNEIKGIGHRAVHGGDKFDHTVLVDEDVIAQIEKFRLHLFTIQQELSEFARSKR